MTDAWIIWNRFPAAGCRLAHLGRGLWNRFQGSEALVASIGRQMVESIPGGGQQERLRGAGGTQGWAGGSCDPLSLNPVEGLAASPAKGSCAPFEAEEKLGLGFARVCARAPSTSGERLR